MRSHARFPFVPPLVLFKSTCMCKPCRLKVAVEELFFLHARTLVVVSITKSAQVLIATGSLGFCEI